MAMCCILFFDNKKEETLFCAVKKGVDTRRVGERINIVFYARRTNEGKLGKQISNTQQRMKIQRSTQKKQQIYHGFGVVEG